jgi:hypothetical protein
VGALYLQLKEETNEGLSKASVGRHTLIKVGNVCLAEWRTQTPETKSSTPIFITYAYSGAKGCAGNEKTIQAPE